MNFNNIQIEENDEGNLFYEKVKHFQVQLLRVIVFGTLPTRFKTNYFACTIKICREINEVSPVLHQANLLACEMIHFVHQMAYYITFEVGTHQVENDVDIFRMTRF